MSARTLTVEAHPTAGTGCWRIRHGYGVVLAVLVQPEIEIRLGIRPDAAAIRQAVRDVAPGYGVTESTPVHWRGPK